MILNTRRPPQILLLSAQRQRRSLQRNRRLLFQHWTNFASLISAASTLSPRIPFHHSLLCVTDAGNSPCETQNNVWPYNLVQKLSVEKFSSIVQSIRRLRTPKTPKYADYWLHQAPESLVSLDLGGCIIATTKAYRTLACASFLSDPWLWRKPVNWFERLHLLQLCLYCSSWIYLKPT